MGAPQRPIMVQIAHTTNTPGSDTSLIASQLEQTLADELGVSLKVEFVDENTALASLCSGAPNVAWVSAFTYVAAQRNCDVEPVLATKKGKTPSFTIGTSSEIVGSADIRGLSDLTGNIFCRSAEQDVLTSWVIPALLMSSRGVDPFLNLERIRDYPDDLAMMQALYEGECAAAALQPDSYENLLLDLTEELNDAGEGSISAGDVKAVIRVVVPAGSTSAPVDLTAWNGFETGVAPYDVLVLPPTSALPAALRESITLAMDDFFSDRTEGLRRTRQLLNADGIMPVKQRHYRNFIQLLDSTGWDMTFAR